MAWNEQLRRWGKEREILADDPLDEVASLRENYEWKQLKEIEELAIKRGIIL